ncbi:hypothetical protein RclHR1_00030011 [Rhizophagus clarus]|uniref:F-box domain-containing protein n=1 Tax=Rhizophagus clarus TaxID=94130 RepID=A0A2Z6RHB7_9GLOM|nr:hypothetical protein RclHR1_00030011 [Rhizophagus clarus]GES92301.1 hypothetical protein GLOIN_2v1704706 [Rhizophagus clarus]
MESMITIFRSSFVLRQTIFKFLQIFLLFDLIFYELDKILELKFKNKINLTIEDGNNQKNQAKENNLNLNLLVEDFYLKDRTNDIEDSYINDENKQTKENNLNLLIEDSYIKGENKQTKENNLNVPIEDSYDLDDIIGSNYIRRNPRRKFFSTKSSTGLFNERYLTTIPKINSFEDLSSSESQQISSNVSDSCPKDVLSHPSRDNIIQTSSVETVMEQISTEQNIENRSCEIVDIEMKSDNISQSAKAFTEYEELIVTPLKIEYTDLITTTETITTATTTTSPTTTTTTPTTPNKPIENDALIDEELFKEVIVSQENITSREVATSQEIITSREVIASQEIVTSREVITLQNDITSQKEITSQEIITSQENITSQEIITPKEIVISFKDKSVAPRVPLSFNASIPIDIFIEICYHLPPTSLFSLMCVCKQFRFWLNSSVSYVTQDIWRTSRMKYLERIKLRPPIGMDELSYIKLTMLEQGCQFCGTRKETPKVYWAFRVRCCLSCLKKRVTSPENLPKWAKSPVDITMLVSYETIDSFDSNGKIVVYWNSHLEQTRRECMSTPLKHRGAWIQKKKHWVSEMLKEVIKRERIDELYCRKQSLEDERIFRILLDEFRQIKDEKGQQKYIDKYISQLPTYIEAQDTWRIPFMTNPWPNFIDRLKIEYPKVINKVSRLQQITDMMLTLITSYVTLASDMKISSGQGYQIYLTDPVIDCLQWCPSFINPPYIKNDASIPWTEEYLIETLIPKLRREARHLLKRSDIKRPGPFTSVRGCKNLIKNEVEDKEYFKCKLCWKSARKIYNYEGICRHLTSGRHSIARIDDERMIEVDREKVKKLLPVWFSNFH